MQIAECVLGGVWLHGGSEPRVARVHTISGLAAMGEVRGRPMPIDGSDGTITPPVQTEGSRSIHAEIRLVGTEQQQWEKYRDIASAMVRAKDDAENVDLAWKAAYEDAPVLIQEVRPVSIDDELIPMGPNTATFRIELEAINPRAYGQGQQEAHNDDTVTLTNEGNAPAWPIFVLRGPTKNPRITHEETGLSIKLRGDYTLSEGELLTIRTQPSKRAVVEGASNVNRNGYLDFEQSTFMPIPPGENTFTLTGETHNATTRLTVKWRHTYTG